MSGEVCSDDRFELIDKAKAKLLEATNIEMRPDEMIVLDSILFRCWQMGWLDKLRECDSRYSELFGTPERAARMLEESCHLLYGLRIDGWVSCAGCPVFAKDADVDDCCYSKLLEWLRGDAE